MSVFEENKTKSGSEGYSLAKRQELLAFWQKQFPSTGLVLDVSGSPRDRKIVLLGEFLHCMLRGQSASASILAGHPSYTQTKLNFVGHWCKKFGLQWAKGEGVQVYPPTGANLLWLCYQLNELAPEELKRVATKNAMNASDLIDFAFAKFNHESSEKNDEFLNRLKDYQHSIGRDCEIVKSLSSEQFQPLMSSLTKSESFGKPYHEELDGFHIDEMCVEGKPEFDEVHDELLLNSFETKSESLANESGSPVSGGQDTESSSLRYLGSEQSLSKHRFQGLSHALQRVSREIDLGTANGAMPDD